MIDVVDPGLKVKAIPAEGAGGITLEGIPTAIFGKRYVWTKTSGYWRLVRFDWDMGLVREQYR